MAIQGFFTGDVKIRDLNGVLKAVNGIVEVAADAGTVTSVGLAVGSTGTDVNVANSPITSSGNIVLNLPTASATNRGLLSSTDWAIFSAKQGTITLTTTGNNGSATLTSGTLNIPTYTLAGLGGISLTSLSASSPLLYNNTTGAFSIQVANGSQNGYLSSADWTTFNSKQSALTFSSPLVNTTGTVSIPAATSSVNGYLTSTDWVTFNSKQGIITLTTTGSSGVATLVGTTLNIPNYTPDLSGYVPTSRQLTINGTTYDLSANRSWSVGTVTSVGITMPSAFAVSSSPVTGSGTISVTGAGNATQYIRGDGALATFPTNGGGGGASVSYYLNGSVNQGTFGGNTYYEMNKTPIIGAGTDFTINADGYIAQFITDANDPALLKIPAGNWNFETYFQASSGGGTPTFYIELYKYNGTTFTLIASNSGSPKVINDGTNIEAYFSALAVPETVLTLTDRIAIRIYVTHSGRTITLHTENSNLCQVITTFTTGLAALNGLTEQVQYLATGTSGTDFNIASATATHTFNLPTASATNRGALSSADWTTFNSKQPAGSYITALTGEATASGPGSATVTLSTSAVTGKLLTGLNLTGGGTIAATDSILQAFGKVQNQISGMVGGVTFQGTWNASTNTPTLTSSVGTKGYYYIVDVAGSTNLNGITDWKIGDWAIFNGTTWDKVDNTDAVSSVNGFTGAVSLTTSNIAEGTNLYYLDSRARLALSFTAGSGAYNNTTGVITIPTNTSQLTNGANYITLSSLSASSPLAYNSGSGAFSIQVATGSQNGYLSSSDWTTFNSKQNAITLTTTGSSGSSTLVGATLNVPTYTLSGLGGVPTTRQLTINGTAYDLSADRSWSVGTHTGSLTSGYIPKATGTTSLTDSLVYDTGTAVLIGTTTASTSKFMVYSTTADNHYQAIGSAPSFRFADTITSPTYTGIVGLATASNHFIIGAAAGDMVLANNTTSSLGNFLFGTGTTERMRITPTGNVSINNTNNTYRFDVTGTVRFTGQLRLESTITDGTYTYTLPSATGTLALVGGAGVGTVTSVGLSSATSGVTIGSTPITTSGTITLAIATASGSQQGLLSSTDWTTFNNKQNALTNPVTGTGTTNYLPKFTGTSTIGNSLVFDNGTNVGINRNNPTRTLDILGGTGIGTVLKLEGAAGTTTYLQLAYNGATNAQSGYIGYNSSSQMQFFTNDTLRATLDASGNLGLGVTPSAWSGFTAFDIGSTGNLSSFGGTSDVQLNANAFFNGSGWIYKTTSAASRFRMNSNQFEWWNAPSGTAGNAISFTQAMTLNASGQLGIATTSPASVLEVAGTSSTSDFRISRTVSASTYFYISAPGGSPSTATLGVSGTSVMALNASGNVGIGTTSPAFAGGGGLHINQSGTDTRLHLTNSTTGALSTDGFELALVGNDVYYDSKESAGTHIFYTAGSERMRITSGGNVGIGTTNPSGYRLKVQNTGTTGISIETVGSDSGNPQLQMLNGATDTTIAATSNGLELTAYSAHALLLRTSNVERMRITSGGDVVIGGLGGSHKLTVNVSGGADREMFIAGVSGVSNGFRVRYNNATGQVRVSMTSLPTSSSGLSTGDIWNDGGTLKIV